MNESERIFNTNRTRFFIDKENIPDTTFFNSKIPQLKAKVILHNETFKVRDIIYTYEEVNGNCNVDVFIGHMEDDNFDL